MVWTRFGAIPAWESCAVSAMVKQPAWAAPINSSGFVADCPSSSLDLKEYGPSKAPLPTFRRPLPWTRLPFHSASAFRIGIKPPLRLLFNLFTPSPVSQRLFVTGTAVSRMPDGCLNLRRALITRKNEVNNDRGRRELATHLAPRRTDFVMLQS